MAKIRDLEERVEEVARKPDEERAYEEGHREGEIEAARFYHLLPFLFQQTITEYLDSVDWQKPTAGMISYPANKEEAKQYWQAIIQKETEQQAALAGFLASKGNSQYECPACGIRYYSGLLMAYHQFDKHAIRTRNDEGVAEKDSLKAVAEGNVD